MRKGGPHMSFFLLSADKCPKCERETFWPHGFDYDTCEQVQFCTSCGHEVRTFDKYAKETWEFLEKAIKEGKVRSIKIAEYPSNTGKEIK